MSLTEDLAAKAREFSRLQLLRFSGYTDGQGIPTVVVGGWAVYSFNPYLKSIDIDGIVPAEHFQTVESLLLNQCGWRKTTTDIAIWKKFFKQIPDANVGQCIYFDLLSVGLVNAFHEDNKKRIPFQLCFDPAFYERKNIEDILTVNVPRKELLLLLKLKAYRDRLFDLNHAARAKNTVDADWLQAKMTKDLSDSIALIDPAYGRIDLGLLNSLVNSCQLKFLKKTMIELPTKTESVEQYRSSQSAEVKEWVDTIISAFD